MSIESIFGYIKSTAKIISLELAVVLVLTTILGSNQILSINQVQLISSILMYSMVFDTLVRLIDKRLNEIKLNRAEVNYKITVNDFSRDTKQVDSLNELAVQTALEFKNEVKSKILETKDPLAQENRGE